MTIKILFKKESTANDFLDHFSNWKHEVIKDAEKYNDLGANTFYNVNESMKYLNIPNLEKLGVGYLDNYNGINICSTKYYNNRSKCYFR